MRCKMILFAALLASLFLNSLATGHPGHSHRKASAKSSALEGANERTWTDAAGGSEVRGTFVAVKDGHVQIRLADGSLMNVKLSQLTESDQKWILWRRELIRRANEVADQDSDASSFALTEPDAFEDEPELESIVTNEIPLVLAKLDRKKTPSDGNQTPEIARAFEAFVKLKAIKTRWDDRYFYVESKGLPNHRMMVGITSWQQQVPLPQSYFGQNAWQIPLHPIPAKNPQSTKNNFLRGAIAVAANGIPIFNPLNNRGDDAYLFGELDEYGGHCGRADDYHYHIAPVHLQKTIGKQLPIAYALDGYPIYGYEEPDGSKVEGLDAFNGHKDKEGIYHYHATANYPYLNGGFYGEVAERGGQVDPQPRAEPIRPDLRPLRDARITDFVESKPGSFVLTYEIKGKKGTVSYTLNENREAKFVFVDTDGKSTTETYKPKTRDTAGEGKDRRPPPRRGEGPPRANQDSVANPKSSEHLPKLDVTSSAFESGESIPIEFTGDGAGVSPPIEWKNVPPSTQSFALNLWHVPGPNEMKSYWVVYNIPANVRKLDKNNSSTGTTGINDKKRQEYEPMKSKGPGAKQYHITVYALSGELKLSPEKADRASLLKAIKDITLAEGTLDFQYERKGKK